MFLLLCASPLETYAQVSPEARRAAEEAQRIQREEQQRLREDQRQLRERAKPRTPVDISPQKRDENLPQEQCWEIHTLELEGISLLSDKEQEDLHTQFTNRCLRLGDINAILNEITRLYFDKGYIAARAYIAPNQDLKSGRLRIHVEEGALERIRIEDGQDGRTVPQDLIFPQMVGKPFNLRDVEQGLEQIHRLASNKATMDIQPGSEVSTSILSINNQPREPYSYTLGVNNQGSWSTGEHQFSLSSTVDNPSGRADSFGLTFRRSLPLNFNRFTRAVVGNYSIPYGYTTLSLSGTVSEFATPIILPDNTLRSSGSSMEASGTLDQVIYRDKTDILHLFGTLARKRSKSYMNEGLLETSSTDLATFEMGMKYNTSFLDGTLEMTISNVQGLPCCGSNKDHANQSVTIPRMEFSKNTANISWQRPFALEESLPGSFATQLSGQISKDVLPGSEQTSLGGYSSVRGYPNVSLGGDRGGSARNELSLSPKSWENLLDLGDRYTLFAAYDFGKVWGHHGNPGGTVTGMAYGLKANVAGLSFEFLRANPLTYPGHMAQPDPPESFTYFGVNTTLEGFKAIDLPPVASEHHWFVGLERGIMKWKITNPQFDNARINLSQSEPYTALHVGRRFDRSSLYATFYGVEEESDLRMDRQELTFETRLFDAALQPVVGVSLGYLTYEERELDRKNPGAVLRGKNRRSKDHLKVAGLSQGAHLGLVYEGERFVAGLTHSYTKMDEGDDLEFNGVQGHLEIKSVTTTAFHVSLRF